MEPTPRAAIARALAERMLALAPHDAPPVRLRPIADALGVEIRFRDLDEDGRVVSVGDRLVIEMHPTNAVYRQRFTLAHELAHVMLWREEGRRGGYPALPDFDYEERLCDRIAGELLIPARFLWEYLEGRPLNLFRLREIARRTKSSPSAAAVAVREVTGKLAMLVAFERGATGWIPTRVVGRPFGLNGKLRLTPDSELALEAMSSGSASLTVSVGGRRFLCRSDIERQHGRATLLVTGLSSRVGDPNPLSPQEVSDAGNRSATADLI